MKFLTFMAILVFSLICTGTALAAPELTVDQPDFNFGSVQEGAKVNHIFVIKNDGNEPLNIKHVRPSCGCTAANAVPPIIQPGKKGEIKATFNSANFSGDISKNIVLDTNDPKKATYTLSIKGKVVSEIHVDPKQLNLGQVKVETTKTMTLTVENRGSKPLKLTSVKSPMPQVGIKSDKNLVKPGESSQILVSVTPRSDDRFLSGYLSITTDSPSKPEITVPIYGSLTR